MSTRFRFVPTWILLSGLGLPVRVSWGLPDRLAARFHHLLPRLYLRRKKIRFQRRIGPNPPYPPLPKRWSPDRQ